MIVDFNTLLLSRFVLQQGLSILGKGSPLPWGTGMGVRDVFPLATMF